MPENFTNSGSRQSLIILDDLLKEVYSKEMCHLFTKGSHNRNISLILITQKLLHQGRPFRDISFHSKYIVILKNFRDKSQFTHLARQVFPEDSSGLYVSYLDATANPHGYLVLDLSLDTDELLRVRTNIIPNEVPPITYTPLTNETRTFGM